MKKIVGIIFISSLFVSACIPRITQKGSAEVSDTFGWKIYHNKEFKFEFKYPDDYILKQQSGSEIVFEKIFRPSMPSSAIHLRIYPERAIEDVIKLREYEINDGGLFDLNFEKVQGQTAEYAYRMDSYSDALGATRYSEKVFRIKNTDIVISVQGQDTVGNEFEKLNTFLSNLDIQQF